MDLALSGNDLAITDGELTLVTGIDAIAQHLKIRLRTFLGEWFLDQRIGIPYFQYVFVKSPNIQILTALFRKVILTTPGVLSIFRFGLDVDTSERTLDVSFVAIVDGDVAIRVTYSNMVVVGAGYADFDGGAMYLETFEDWGTRL